MNLPNRKWLFIGGMHRSGTSIVHRYLRATDVASGFWNTGVPEDEGQHLQSVFPPASKLGGIGRFGFNPASHMTEDDVTVESAELLWAQWKPFWDLSKSILLEKSPPNLLKTRYLQASFPNSYFLVVTRHPIASSYATHSYTRRRFLKWRRVAVADQLNHWFHCHSVFESDRPFLKRVLILRYEDFVSRPQAELAKISAFVDEELKLATTIPIDPKTNDSYFTQYRRAWPRWTSRSLREVALQYEPQANRYGYSLRPEDVECMRDSPSIDATSAPGFGSK